MTTTTRPNFFGTFTGYGPTRKTRKSAQREADQWNASGTGGRYLHPPRTNITPNHPAHYETIVCEVHVVDGGFACAYLTTREEV